MLELILEFAACSRAAGLRVSTAEVLDCARHLELIDVLEEPSFRDVLRANFAKSRREQERFEHLYRLFFLEGRSPSSIPRSSSLAGPLAEVLAAVDAEAEADPAFRAVMDLLRGNPLAYLQQLQQLEVGGPDSDPNRVGGFGPLVRRLQIMTQIDRIGQAVTRLLAASRQSLSWEDRRALGLHVNERLERARQWLRQNTPIASPQPVLAYEQHLNRLGDKSFFSLSRQEVEEMREVIARWVRKLKDTVQRRHHADRRGMLDLKKTLRTAARYQGVPMKIVYRHPPRRKAKIVTLCDVSGSVWSAARFMLNLLYALQDCFLQVRSFVFVAQLAEITSIFERYEIHQAIDRVLQEAKLDYNAATDYGATLRQFRREYMDILNRKTTLIFIGDARTNYTLPEERILEEMRDKCRRVIWLNPESLIFWNTGDSRLKAYQPYCHQVRHCQNLNQLIEFIRTLVL